MKVCLPNFEYLHFNLVSCKTYRYVSMFFWNLELHKKNESLILICSLKFFFLLHEHLFFLKPNNIFARIDFVVFWGGGVSVLNAF